MSLLLYFEVCFRYGILYFFLLADGPDSLYKPCVNRRLQAGKANVFLSIPRN